MNKKPATNMRRMWEKPQIKGGPYIFLKNYISKNLKSIFMLSNLMFDDPAYKSAPITFYVEIVESVMY